MTACGIVRASGRGGAGTHLDHPHRDDTVAERQLPYDREQLQSPQHQQHLAQGDTVTLHCRRLPLAAIPRESTQ
jgi:hypothetical protein